jgi:hypothetical protein
MILPRISRQACANDHQQVAVTVASMFVSVVGITDGSCLLQQSRQQWPPESLVGSVTNRSHSCVTKLLQEKPDKTKSIYP